MNWGFKSSKIQNLSKIGVANIGGYVVSAGLWFILAGFLQSEKYGELSYLIAIAGIVTSVCLIGGPQSIIVFSAKKIQLQGTIFIISFFSSIFSAVILYIFLQNLEIGIFVIGSVIYNLTISELLGRKSYGTYSKVFLLQKVLQFILAIGFYFIMGEAGILLGIGLSFFVMIKVFYENIKNNKLDFKLLKEKMTFIINIYIRDLTKAFKGNIAHIMIAPLFGFSLLGNYHLGLQVFGILAIIPGIITNFVISEEASGESMKKIKKYTISLSVVFAGLGFFVAPEVLPYFFPKYENVVDLIPILSLAVIPATISNMFISTFLSKENSKPIVIGYAISIVVLIIGIFILGSTIGALGLAVSFLLSQISYTIFLASIKKFYKNI
ncbi:lipopolysaccharide biosynthesis protein [Nitrosopumilus sp.]|uniref:lipopolysaccharide biosynthesis protein n=1 Tax=Nitrosopumilus sp. TaxID=2024843 RepID=UPI003D14BAE2